MANTLELGNGKWATGKDTVLAYNDLNNNFKPLPFSFSRASSATVVNKAGLIETVGSGEPRIDFKDNTKGALLLEPQRTNSLVQSNQFDTTWIDSNTTEVSGYLGLDGTNSAWLLTKTASSNANIRQNITFSGTHTFSVYLKKGTLTSVALRSTGGLDARVEINLIDGTTSGELNTTSVKTESVGNDWWRCSLTFEATVNTAVRIYPDSITGTTAGNIYIQYAQAEEGSYATSYIPTSGSAVTRVADACSQIVPDSAIGQTEGTVFLDFKPQALDGASRYLSIENSSSSGGGWMGVFASLVSGTIIFRFYGDGWDINSSLMIEKGTRYKIAFSYKNGVQTSIYVNGNLLNNITASLSGKSYQKIRLSEGATSFGDRGYADFNDIKLYDTVKTDNELQKLTTI